ncbi:VWA domain-containing protein [Brevibacillus humidisoli]|uniref:vWA domain-containing protein n=1 Tax=Brevibacillus humidisoli TaxID=2895522 RepID=UPI001E3BB8E1|nr:VWA domain-containing protein [Brevibacillus humidisoli]UFJ39244.1 VWA domain-containing protein [Brevibacillus humidisoli]
MRNIKLLGVTILLFTMLSACSPDEGKQNEPSPETVTKTTDKEKAEYPSQSDDKTDQTTSREEKIKDLQAMIPEGIEKIPETAEEFAAFAPGRFAGVSYSEHREEIESILRQFPNIDNPDDEIIEMYFLALLGLFAEDYPDPQQLIDEIKMASFGNPEIDDPRYQFKEQYNVEIILDASGSMAGKVGGKTKMEAAKEAIKSFAESLPEEAHVALRVYGHKGSSQESDKELSCGSSELVYDLQPYDAEKLQTALNQFQPTGYTPIARSLQEAQNDLKGLSGEKNTNIIYLVSDGIETCDGNPVEVAKQLADSEITPLVNVIGFGVDGEGQQQLKEVAKAANGRYVLIQNQKELREEFEKAEEVAQKWRKWRFEASQDANSTRVRRMLDIGAFALEWVFSAGDENHHLRLAESDLEDYVSKDIIDEIVKLRKEHYKRAKSLGDEQKKFLNSLNNKTYKETIEAIHQKYNENTKSNETKQ